MKILIVGANGLLGKTATAYLHTNHEIRALSHQDLDITDAAAITAAVNSFHPDLILNCAAAARVDRCETEYQEAWAVNAIAPGLLAAAAANIGAAIMHISTDYVFDGNKREPYTIHDLANPISAYGRSKLGGEEAAIAANPAHYIVRVARLFGAGGENFGSRIFDYLQKAVDSNAKLKVFDYPVSQATYLPDLVVRLAEIAAHKHYGIYQITNSGPILSWYQFALLAAQMMNLSPDLIEITSYQQLGLPAARPQYSALACLLSAECGFTPLPDWRDGLMQQYKLWK